MNKVILIGVLVIAFLQPIMAWSHRCHKPNQPTKPDCLETWYSTNIDTCMDVELLVYKMELDHYMTRMVNYDQCKRKYPNEGHLNRHVRTNH